MTNLEKQQMQINEFERINRSEKYYAKHGKPYELLSITEKAIYDSNKRKEAKANNPQKAKEEVRISFYNPNNPLNGSSSWSKQQWEEYKSKHGNKKS